jgi:exopolysaccharide/PEP-CTERM locus tyrosine autokinase
MGKILRALQRAKANKKSKDYRKNENPFTDQLQLCQPEVSDSTIDAVCQAEDGEEKDLKRYSGGSRDRNHLNQGPFVYKEKVRHLSDPAKEPMPVNGKSSSTFSFNDDQFSKVTTSEPYVDRDKLHKRLCEMRKECSIQSYQKLNMKSKIPKKCRQNLFTQLKPNSIISECFKSLRTRFFELLITKNIRTILVTSSQPSEGKTFISSNLAVSIGKSFDRHVLLIDADFKRPCLHEMFNIRSKEGLSDFLLNDRYQLSDLIFRTEIPKLSVLTTGYCYENSSELLSSELMKLFVQEVKYRYDDRYIIFDTPPASISETLALAGKVDAVLLVVRAGKTSRRAVKKTIDTIGREKTIFVVLNYCSADLKRYYNYYKFYQFG